MHLENLLKKVTTKKLISFYNIVEKLKTTMRYDNQEGIADSVADHSFRLGVMAYLVAEHYNLDIDKTKAVDLALIHDMGEYLHGDVDQRKIREGVVSKDDKEKLEEEGLNELKKALPRTMRNYLSNLWEEYNSLSTPESKYIKALDKLESMLRISNKGYKVFMPSFTGENDGAQAKLINYADNAVRSYPPLACLNSIVKNRIKSEFDKVGFSWPSSCNEFLDSGCSDDLVQIVSFLDTIENLKCELRYGKVKTSMSESVAGHMFKLAVMTFSFAKQYDLKLDVYHALKLALVHDLGECFEGDIPAADVHLGEISKEEKFSIEERGFKKL
ncbi:5'-deoxynucleotidase YfbR [Candidatus Tiddalikarchaeum anstoanum]|nr:5'-deoxynucleotidase YfbR [Candidatus Tiddalikarchaeum anstoanum]